MEPKIRHLEMIQTAMNRASDNSLRIKGFAMLLLAGALALLLRDGVSAVVISLHLAVFLWLVIVILGALDIYFIQQSDLYKILYNKVRARSEDDIDFDMQVGPYDNELNRQYEERPSFQLWASIFLYLSIFLIALAGTLPSLAR